MSATDYDYDVFVSYPSEARDEAADFASVLKSEGLRTFIDQDNLKFESDWSRALYAAREAASAFAVLLNENTVAGRPQWDEILHIIRRADESNDVRIIPVFLDEIAYSSVHPDLKRLYGLDARSEGGIENTARKLAEDLKRSR